AARAADPGAAAAERAHGGGGPDDDGAGRVRAGRPAARRRALALRALARRAPRPEAPRALPAPAGVALADGPPEGHPPRLGAVRQARPLTRASAPQRKAFGDLPVR